MYHISYIISYHITSYHSIYTIVSYHISCHISYHNISYHVMSYHMIYHIISHHITIQHNTSHHIISYHISFHIISYILSCHVMSCHVILYHIITYIISNLTQSRLSVMLLYISFNCNLIWDHHTTLITSQAIEFKVVSFMGSYTALKLMCTARKDGKADPEGSRRSGLQDFKKIVMWRLSALRTGRLYPQ